MGWTSGYLKITEMSLADALDMRYRHKWVNKKLKSDVGSMQISAINAWCKDYYLSPIKRICVFQHSIMTNFN